MQPDGELSPVTRHERDESRMGDFTRIMQPQGVLTPEYMEMALLQYAQASHSALDLAEGQGLLGPDLDAHCDPEDHSEWEGVPKSHPMDDRRRPVIWDRRSLLTVTPPYDGWASYGRVEAFEFVIRHSDREVALMGDAWQVGSSRAPR